LIEHDNPRRIPAYRHSASAMSIYRPCWCCCSSRRCIVRFVTPSRSRDMSASRLRRSRRRGRSGEGAFQSRIQAARTALESGCSARPPRPPPARQPEQRSHKRRRPANAAATRSPKAIRRSHPPAHRRPPNLPIFRRAHFPSNISDARPAAGAPAEPAKGKPGDDFTPRRRSGQHRIKPRGRVPPSSQDLLETAASIDLSDR